MAAQPASRREASRVAAAESSAICDSVRVGDGWIRAAGSAVLAVPSAVIAPETNFLLNPRHPDFSRIRIGQPESFEVDARLVGGQIGSDC